MKSDPFVMGFVAMFAVVQGQMERVVTHNCDPRVAGTCGPGHCLALPTGNRCRCGVGRMGVRCQRPCQDVYRSCKRWQEEGRCEWGHFILPFFEDNCAATCRVCQAYGDVLAKPLPVGLEPLAWLVGRWEASSPTNFRFPASLAGAGGYREVLEIQPNEVNMFDRPTLNYSVRALSADGRDQHHDLGFLTMRPAAEDTGFMQDRRESPARDLVAVEMTSNVGMATIEEGVMLRHELALHVTHKVTFGGINPDLAFVSARRRFVQRAPDRLEEVIVLEDGMGRKKTFVKQFIRTFDYLHNFRTRPDNDLGLKDEAL